MKQFGKLITKQIQRIKLIPILLFMCLFFGGCGSKTAAASPVTEKTSQAVTEEKKRNGQKYERVIALSKSNAELWILAGGSLIATSEDALKIEGLNPEVVSLGDMDHVSLEAVTALEPDLLILFSTDLAQKALGEAAEGIGIQVYYTNIDNFDDYDAVVKDFTAYTGYSDHYTKYVTDIKDQIKGILEQVPVDAEKKTYLLLHVSATKSKVEKNDYFASEILNDLGLTNIASDNSAFDELSLEAIISADPDYIFVVPRGNEKKALESFDQLFTSQSAWSTLSAVKNGQYHLLSKDIFGLKPNDKWAEAYRQAYEILYGKK